MAFSNLKSQRSSSFNKLNSQLQNLNTSKPSADDRFWKLEVDKAQNGYAVLRFLPSPDGEDSPFVRMWDHGFQANGWYIENSLTTLGQEDPVSEYNTKLWNSGIDADKDQARKQKRRLSFYSNVYVVKDSANPANEGKVFLFKYGKKIFDKLNDAMNPQYEDESPINPFDLWEGADFKLKARKVEGYRNYDKSEFDSPSVLGDMSDDELEEVYNSEHSLSELIDPKNFKSYAELQAKLHKVLALNVDAGAQMPRVEAPESPQSTAPVASVKYSDDDEDLSFFKNLAAES